LKNNEVTEASGKNQDNSRTDTLVRSGGSGI